MKKILITILFSLSALIGKSQAIEHSLATLKVYKESLYADSITYLNTVLSGKNWSEDQLAMNYGIGGFTAYTVYTDYLVIHNSEQDKINYYGAWRVSDSIAIPDGTGDCYCAWATQSTDSLTVKFKNATSFQWVGERMAHHGKANVYFDGIFQETIDTYQATSERNVVNWSIDNLDTGKIHIFKIVVNGEKNPASTGTAVVATYFKLDLPPAPPPPVDPNNPVVVNDTITIRASGYEDDVNGTNPPLNSMDGDLATRFSVLGIDEAIEYELHEIKLLESIDFNVWNGQRVYTYDFLFSEDGAEWQSGFLNFETSGVADQVEKLELPQDTPAKYIRIRNKGNNVNEWMHIEEISFNLAITEPPIIEPPDTIPPPIIIPPPVVVDEIDIVRQGYYLVLMDGVQQGGGHSEYDKAVEKAVNLLLKNGTSNILIQAPTWRVEY